MKKVSICLMVLLFAAVCFAQNSLNDKKAELTKVWQYIQELDVKIEKAREKNQTDKTLELKDLKRMAMDRAEALKKEIADMEKTVPQKPAVKDITVQPQGKEVPLVEAQKKAGFISKLGFGAGGGLGTVGFTTPLNPTSDLLIDAGMALGNQYSVVIIDIDGKISFGSRYLGLGFTYANYSETVADIPGISGNIDKGGKFGVDIFGGIPLDKQLNLQAGINTAIGFTGSLLYSF